MTHVHVRPADVAKIGGVTEKHVRRMINRAKGAEPEKCPFWFGTKLQSEQVDGNLMVVFATLPQHIREALLLKDQLEIPGLQA